MKKWLDRALNLSIGIFTAFFIGDSLYAWWEDRTHPGVYAAWSAPWYTRLWVNGGALAVYLAMALAVKCVLHKKHKAK